MSLGGVIGQYVEQDDQRALWLGPDEWLLQSSTEAGPIAQRLEEASAGLPHAVVDVSSTYMTLRIAGEYSEFLINHGCPLDLSLKAFNVGKCTRTLLGKTEIIISRVEQRAFEIDVVRSFTVYAARFLQEARLALINPLTKGAI
jgi:sarcosine oxidase subunit gamma